MDSLVKVSGLSLYELYSRVVKRIFCLRVAVQFFLRVEYAYT